MFEEKNNNKKNQIKKGIAATLASVMLVGGVSPKKIELKEQENEDMNDLNESKRIETAISIESKYKNEGKQLYERAIAANSFVVQFQKDTNLKWDELMAVGIVEYINGEYPTILSYMSEDAAKKELSKITQCIQLIISGNLFPETKNEDIIDLTNYMENEADKEPVSDAMAIGRACVEASLIKASFIDPVTGKKVVTLEPSNEYIKLVERFLIYEKETLNSEELLESGANVRFLVPTIFEIVNNSIRFDMGVLNKDGEVLSEDTIAYPKYFKDENNGTIYLPMWHPETITYFGFQINEGELIRTTTQLSEEEMHNLAGINDFEQTSSQKYENNIVECGLSADARKLIDIAVNDYLELSNTYGKKI